MAYALSTPSGNAQCWADGTPKMIVDSQHKAAGEYGHITENNPYAMIALAIFPSYK